MWRRNAASEAGRPLTARAAAVARLRYDAMAALGRSVGAEDIVAIAVSGGPDSMVLLALAGAAWPGQVIAATVDHGLRADAADEAAAVAEYCRGQGCIPHTTLTPAVPLGTANLQAEARSARYALLIDWACAAGATILATAHHADDQAETFLMRAARGAGLSGLAAIRPYRRIAPNLALLRPLITWRRADLRVLAMDWQLPFVDDPSNISDRYDRTRFRQLLADNNWLDAEQVARAAEHLAEVDRDLRAIEGWLLATRSLSAKPGERRLDVTGLPREMRRRLARAAITSVREDQVILSPSWSPSSNIEALLDALAAGKGATQAGIMASSATDIWHFRAAPPRRST